MAIIGECPQCGSKRSYRDGLRSLTDGKTVQRWLCRNCGYRFSKNSLNKTFYRASSKGSTCQIGAVPNAHGQVINLANIEPLKERLAGATTSNESKGKIIEFTWWMKKEGYKESTILGYAAVLKSLMNKGANLLDPNSVKSTIAQQNQWSIGRKAVAAKAYNLFVKTNNLHWTKPIYEAPRKLPFIPTEKEIDNLIAGCNSQIATFLRLIKETGIRAGEAFQLKWTHIDLETSTVRITPEKGSNPRMFRLSNGLLAMLNKLPRIKDQLFAYQKLNYLRRTFQRQRQKTAHKFANARIHRITFHTLRHWKATMEYHKTKDILHVMQLLGHKNIKNTLIYTQLIHFKDDDFICKTAKTINRARSLIEAGFEYICEIDDTKLFRKLK